MITALSGEVLQEINEVFLLHGTKPDIAKASVIPDLIWPVIIDSKISSFTITQQTAVAFFFAALRHVYID